MIDDLEALKVNGIARCVMLGNSMSPLLRDQEIFYIKSAAKKEPKVFDIVLYKNNDIYICHYIRKIVSTPKGLMIYTQGINNRHLDNPILSSEIIGYATKKLSIKNKLIYTIVDSVLNYFH